MPDQLHLAVALDGAGWHPAAWREPNARPHELFSPRYWADLVRIAERGLLDLVTGTSPATTPTGRCPTSTRTLTRRRSSRAAPSSTRTASRPWRAGGRSPRRAARPARARDRPVRARPVRRHPQVAQQIDDFVQNDGSDGLIIGSHLVPWGLDEFVDKVVPLLQERGSLRAEYTGTTLRDNLGLPPLPRNSDRRVAAAGE